MVMVGICQTKILLVSKLYIICHIVFPPMEKMIFFFTDTNMFNQSGVGNVYKYWSSAKEIYDDQWHVLGIWSHLQYHGRFLPSNLLIYLFVCLLVFLLLFGLLIYALWFCSFFICWLDDAVLSESSISLYLESSVFSAESGVAICGVWYLKSSVCAWD